MTTPLILRFRAAAFSWVPPLGAAALFSDPAACSPTNWKPRQDAGPDRRASVLIPTSCSLDTDNDLIIVNDNLTPAVGEVTHLSGKILDGKGNPVKNALVEIWQVDSKAVYIHTGDSGKEEIATRTSRASVDS